jgi:hypothetical protein
MEFYQLVRIPFGETGMKSNVSFTPKEFHLFSTFDCSMMNVLLPDFSAVVSCLQQRVGFFIANFNTYRDHHRTTSNFGKLVSVAGENTKTIAWVNQIWIENVLIE